MSDYKKLPNGERPEAQIELRAFAFGAAATCGEGEGVYTSVRLQQAVDLMGVRTIVYSELEPAEARSFAQALIERAEVVEGTRTEVSS